MIRFNNNSKAPQLRGCKLIPPGDGRIISEQDLLPSDIRDGLQAWAQKHDAPAAMSEPAQGQNLADILAGNVKSVIDALTALDDAELAALDALESGAQKPRKGVLEAIAEETLERVNDSTTVDSLVKSLPSQSAEQLQELLVVHENDETITAAIQALLDTWAADAANQVIIDGIAEASTEQLASMAELHAENEAISAAIETELQARADA